MTTERLRLTEAQEEALCLIGHDAADCIDAPLRGARGELIDVGLVAFSPDEGWRLTRLGRAEFDHLCRD
jgi:hypothetical protein